MARLDFFREKSVARWMRQTLLRDILGIFSPSVQLQPKSKLSISKIHTVSPLLSLTSIPRLCLNARLLKTPHRTSQFDFPLNRLLLLLHPSSRCSLSFRLHSLSRWETFLFSFHVSRFSTTIESREQKTLFRPRNKLRGWQTLF